MLRAAKKEAFFNKLSELKMKLLRRNFELIISPIKVLQIFIIDLKLKEN